MTYFQITCMIGGGLLATIGLFIGLSYWGVPKVKR